jgi:cell division septal protein FtsQ
LSHVAEAAERCPLVRSAVASRHLPRTIIVTPTLREPMCAVEGADGFTVLDMEGVAFGKYPQRPASVPLVRGVAPVPDKYGARVHLWYAGTLATCTSAMHRAGMGGDYAVDVTNHHLIAVYLPSGLECKIGEADSLAKKIALCARIIADLRQKGEQAEYIDVRVPERPVWKPRSVTTIAGPSAPPDDATKPATTAKPSDEKPKHAAAKPKKPKIVPKHPIKAQNEDDDDQGG